MAVLILGLAIAAIWFSTAGRRWVVVGMVVVFVASLGLMASQALALLNALSTQEGPVDEPDPVALASAEAKVEEVAGHAGFRLELDEEEITALVQQGLTETDTPLASVTFDVDDTEEVVKFTGRFKSGDLTVAATARLNAELGGVSVELVEADLGNLNVPGMVSGAIEDIVSGVADFEEALGQSGASVQSVEYTDTSLVLVGTTRDGAMLTSDALLQDLRASAASLGGAVAPPPEQLGPGRVDSTSADGASYYVALGDSLAANVGVTRPRDGYVSRFHAELERRDGTTYGLRNFGISGETSGSLIQGGQLDDALAFMEANNVAYVTIDIGANDLLGHVGSPDCGEDLGTPACQERITDSLDAYRTNLELILDRISEAAPNATIIFLQAYNPFSLGMSSFVEFENQSNEAVQALNAVAAEVAGARGVLIADGFTPMLGTTSVTTHMTESPPDIHPKPIGFDILAVALAEALG
ncbi:MAG: SGNH/GDSL hydrolase family protein [Acidimicrobiia bacterium]